MLWSRIGIHTILWTNEDNSSFQSDLKKIGVEIDRNSARSSKGQLYLVTQVGSSFQRDYPDVPVVVEKGRYLVVDLSFEQLASMDKNDENCWMLRPLMPNQVILDVIRPERKEVVPWIQSLVASISQPTYQSYLTQLTIYRTRHSLSSFFRDAASMGNR